MREYIELGDETGAVLHLCEDHAAERNEAATDEYGPGNVALMPVHDDYGRHAFTQWCDDCEGDIVVNKSKSAITEYEAATRLQDMKDVFTLADTHMFLKRCIGGRLQNDGFVCPHCSSFEPESTCSAPMIAKVDERGDSN